MDNVTHTLFAATLARTPLGRAGRGTTAALILASNAPDIDIVTTAGGAMKYLQWHRGMTHGPLGVVGLGLLTAGLVSAGLRIFDRERRRDHPSFALLAAVSILGVFFHVLMDLPTSYGTRPLSPFSWRWYGWDWLPILDIYLLGALAAGLAIGQRWPGARRRNAAIVLALMAANYGFRAASHQRAIAIAPAVFGPLLPDPCEPARPRQPIDSWPRPVPLPKEPQERCLVELAALPDFVSPFRWRIVAQLSNSYSALNVNLLDARLQRPAETRAPWRLAVSYPNEWTPAVFEAAATPRAQVFLGFSRFPSVRSVVDRDGVTTVRWTDVRFAPVPASARPPDRAQAQVGNDLFSIRVRIAPDGSEIKN